VGPADSATQQASRILQNPTLNHFFLSATLVHSVLFPVAFDPFSSFPCISLSGIKHPAAASPDQICREIGASTEQFCLVLVEQKLLLLQPDPILAGGKC